MSDYDYQGPQDIDRAIGFLVALDADQRNALEVLQLDEVITGLQAEYERASADPAYRPDDDFLVRLRGYLERADDRERIEREG